MKVIHIIFVISLIFLNSIHRGFSQSGELDFDNGCARKKDCFVRARVASGLRENMFPEDLEKDKFCKFLQDVKMCDKEQANSCDDGIIYHEIIETLEKIEKEKSGLKCDSTINVPSLIFVIISCILVKVF